MQAFIFCGKGTKLQPFSLAEVENGATGLPKALLPIGNRPMIEYVLDWCDQADFKEINVVASIEDIDLISESLQGFMSLREQQFELLSKALNASVHAHHLQRPKPIKFVTSRANSTGECLQKELLERISGDFALLPCDFVTDIPPQILIDQYRNRDSENIALTFYYKNNLENADKKQTTKQAFTVYSENEGSDSQPVLLDVYPTEDVKKSKYLQIRTHLLWKYPNATVSTKLVNSFICFCAYELCQLLSDKKTQDVEKNSGDDDEVSAAKSNATMIKPSYFKNENELIKDRISCNKPLGKIFRDLARRSWQHSKGRETVGMFILPDVGTFIRANNLNAYTEANRFLLRIKAQTLATNTQTTTASASAIGADAIIGPDCTILERSNIKLSAVDAGCVIGNRCHIAGSILHANVTIEDEVTLENVIVGPNAVIGKKSKLTNCYVEGSFVVEPRTVLKGETLTRMSLESEEEYNEDEAISSDSEEDGDYPEGYYDDDDDAFGDDDFFQR
ncbi:hypothetical protein HG537_0F01620 [Torulaspora globosa]|uniref:Translation initiation factor eIF2B subunit gamma n=1 Tax=Torulaspora globosa TaxID=48254 RepID=A0A7H9HVJ8_9SACH|nr:hypothetical protein HG537_0F01620 [Torulaspora sp. CBS 2947]